MPAQTNTNSKKMKNVPSRIAALALRVKDSVAVGFEGLKERGALRPFSCRMLSVVLGLAALFCSTRTASGWIDNSGFIYIYWADDTVYGHPGTLSISWSGDGGSGSVVYHNFDPGTKSAGQLVGCYVAYVSCETVYACPPGGRLRLTGTVTGEAADGTWRRRR